MVVLLENSLHFSNSARQVLAPRQEENGPLSSAPHLEISPSGQNFLPVTASRLRIADDLGTLLLSVALKLLPFAGDFKPLLESLLVHGVWH